MDTEELREALRRLVADRDCVKGHVEGDTFRLHPKTRRRGFPITLYGRIVPDREGTLISAWAFPRWGMILWIPVWVWFCLQIVRAPMWFLMFALIVCSIGNQVPRCPGDSQLVQIGKERRIRTGFFFCVAGVLETSMEGMAESISTFAFIFGGWEIVLILAVVLILWGAKRLPELGRGVGLGVCEFQRAMDDEARDAGKSLGGIYGKPAAEALTPENQTAELYDPAALRDAQGPHKSMQRSGAFISGRVWRRILHFISNLIGRKKI